MPICSLHISVKQYLHIIYIVHHPSFQHAQCRAVLILIFSQATLSCPCAFSIWDTESAISCSSRTIKTHHLISIPSFDLFPEIPVDASEIPKSWQVVQVYLGICKNWKKSSWWLESWEDSSISKVYHLSHNYFLKGRNPRNWNRDFFQLTVSNWEILSNCIYWAKIVFASFAVKPDGISKSLGWFLGIQDTATLLRLLPLFQDQAEHHIFQTGIIMMLWQSTMAKENGLMNKDVNFPLKIEHADFPLQR